MARTDAAAQVLCSRQLARAVVIGPRPLFALSSCARRRLTGREQVGSSRIRSDLLVCCQRGLQSADFGWDRKNIYSFRATLTQVGINFGFQFRKIEGGDYV